MLKNNMLKGKAPHSTAPSIHKNKLDNFNEIEYYSSCSGREVENIIVLVHGISRKPREIIKSFSTFVNENTLLIAPIFSKHYASDYQRLGRKNKGPRADYILQAIVNELQNKLNFKNLKINLFGFSAGAQFVHRYAFAHPTHVNKVALVAAGWYTLPSHQLSYPIGLKITNEFSDITFKLQRLLRVKFRVYVGEKDYLRDKSLNKNKKIDELQGKNRIERAKNWITLMNKGFAKAGIKNQIKLEILPDVAHDFSEADGLADLCKKACKWIFEN